MQRPAPGEYNPTYQKYFDLVPAGDYLDLLKQNQFDTINFFERIPATRYNHKYAPDKWTIKELLQHIIDTERVFSVRALMAARGDEKTIVERMDEELYAQNVQVNNRHMQNLLEEFHTVRFSTAILFQYFTAEQHKRYCNIQPHPMTTRAIGYFIIGHVNHHINVIKERYL